MADSGGGGVKFHVGHFDCRALWYGRVVKMAYTVGVTVGDQAVIECHVEVNSGLININKISCTLQTLTQYVGLVTAS